MAKAIAASRWTIPIAHIVARMGPLQHSVTFLRYARYRALLLFALMLANSFTGAISIAMLLPLQSFSNQLSGTDPVSRAVRALFEYLGVTPTLGKLLLLIVALFMLKGAITFAQSYVMFSTTIGLRRDIQLQLVRLLGGMTYHHFVTQSAGELNNLLIREVDRFMSAFGKYLRVLLSSTQIFAYLTVTFLLRWDLTVLVLVVGGLLGFMFMRVMRETRGLSVKVSSGYARLQAGLVQFVQNFLYIKTTGVIGEVRLSVDRLFRQVSSYEMRHEMLGATIDSIKEPVAIIILATILFHQVELEGRSLPEVVVIGLYFYRLLGEIVSLQGNWQRFNQVVGGVYTVENARRALIAAQERRGGTPVPSLNVDFEFRSVNFSYGECKVLADVDLHIKPRQMVGFVGRSGSGKTTLFHLLTGLLDPQSGDVLIGGRSYRELDKNSVRERIGYVTQEPVIFDDTLAANISLWRCDSALPDCRERILQAARQAELDDFADNLELQLGERGVRLSGGQRQRVAIARELFKNPDLLIFDEATSSLDSQTEAAIRESIEHMRGQRTMIIIAHRLSTVRNCDTILVLDRGRIVESGSFEELYRREHSLFRSLCLQQDIRL